MHLATHCHCTVPAGFKQLSWRICTDKHCCRLLSIEIHQLSPLESSVPKTGIKKRHQASARFKFRGVDHTKKSHHLPTGTRVPSVTAEAASPTPSPSRGPTTIPLSHERPDITMEKVFVHLEAKCNGDREPESKCSIHIKGLNSNGDFFEAAREELGSHLHPNDDINGA